MALALLRRNRSSTLRFSTTNYRLFYSMFNGEVLFVYPQDEK